jgi:hypothetical protein
MKTMEKKQVNNSDQLSSSKLDSCKLSKVESMRQLYLQKDPKTNTENQCFDDDRLDVIIKKIRTRYEDKIKSLENFHKQAIQNYEERIKQTEEEKNYWHETATKLKSELDNLAHHKRSDSPFRVQQNSIEETTQIKNLNEQIAVEISNYLKKMSDFAYVPSKSNMRGKSVSPLGHSLKPGKTVVKVQINEAEMKRINKYYVENLEQRNELQKELERLWRVCGRMEKVIAEGGEQIMREKAKKLQAKYVKPH